ncbi:MAG: hypothetical protein ABI409_03580 [Ramlibacter sp.]
MPLANTLLPALTKPATARADPCADPAPPCPACGGLKCLCRPRFFPGQLLSDDDLNRLEQYVIDKNRLHNRHLVGWGVACGLEVACSACDADSVTVHAGYALSPCGDDIVMCGDQSVNVCELIRQCKPETVVCEQPYGTAPAKCPDPIERWVLAVCYDERPTRGITALTGAGDSIATPGCRCGGSAGCGCGGGKNVGKSTCSCGGGAGGSGGGGAGCSCGAKGSAYQPSGNRRKLLPQCEPTQICEGFRFTAYKAPAPAKGLTGLRDTPSTLQPGNDLMIAWLYANRARFGPLLERVLCCVLRALDLRAALVEGRAVDGTAAVITYRDYAQALQEFAADFSLHHCRFVNETRVKVDAALEWSRSRLGGALSNADRTELAERTNALDALWMQIATECFCSALLPACPPPATTNCVPLAVLTVRNGERCEVLDICNWQERKLLITWPTISYWLSWLPWHRLREWVARICCEGDRRDTAYHLMTTLLGVALADVRRTTPAATPAPAPAHGAPVRTARNAGAGAATAAPAPAAERAAGFDRAMHADNLLLHMLGEFESQRSGAEGQPMWASLAARVVDGTAFAALAGPAAVREADLGDVEKRLGVPALREQVAALQQTVQRQDEILKALQIINGQGRNG